MSTIDHHDNLWPLAVIVAKGRYSLAQHNESLDQWNKWFKKNEAFYIVRIFLDREAIEHSEEIGHSTILWLQNGAARQIRELVKVMIIVLPEALYNPDRTIHKIFGVSGGFFPSVEAAYDHLCNTTDIQTLFNIDDSVKNELKFLALHQ